MKMDQLLKKHIGLVLGICCVMLMWACEAERDDYVEREPTISIRLFNYDSLYKEGGVEDTLDLIEEELELLEDTLDYFQDSASVVEDSIVVLTKLINDGDESWMDEKEALEAEKDRLEALYEAFEKEDSIVSAHNTYWTAVKTKIEDGELLISSITNVMNDRTVVYEDSSEIWYLPLDMNADSSKMSLNIDGTEYLLTLYYSRDIITNAYDEVVVQTWGFDEDMIFQSGFDSLFLNCETSECIDKEAKIYAYF